MNDRGPGAPPDGRHPWIPGGGPLTAQAALIIVGGYRCGTTSLQAHLAGHPEVNPSTIKEPAFFFTARLADDPPIYPPGHEAAAYLAMFRKKGGRVLLDASATYFNDRGCAERIARALPAARVIVALRDPIARLVSWYRFRVFQGWTPPALGFERWARSQLDDPRPPAERPFFENALHHGLYAQYLPAWLEALGRDRVHLVWFDEFQRDPRAVMQDVARFAGIAPGYFEDHAFSRQNESMKIRRPLAFRVYKAANRRAFELLRRVSPRLNFRLREYFFGVVEPRFLGLFTAPADPVVVPDGLRRDLVAYYRQDLAPLARLAGRDAPWAEQYR